MKRGSSQQAGHLTMFEALEPRLLLNGTVGDFAWHDLNGNGVQDVGGPGLAGAGSVPPTINDILPLPADGGSVMAAIDQLTVEVSGDLEVAGVNGPASWQLRAAGPDGVLDTPDDEIIGLTTDPEYVSGTTISLGISPGPLQVGWYRFTASASLLMDAAGYHLDGNGDETGGDDHVHTFEITTSPGVAIESMDNDALATATALPWPLLEDPAGSGSFVGRGLGSIQPSSDPDWWSFEALAGDVISVSVDTPAGDLNSHVNLYDAGGGHLVQDWNSGPDYDAFISHYSISSSGTYYARVSGEGGTTGSYELRVDLARGIDLESDGQYANDVIAGADPLTLSRGDPGHLLATVAGTTMSREGANTDEDVFLLGTLSAGNAVELSTRLPSTSSWNGVLTVVDSSGAAIADEDGEVLDGHVLATIPTDGVYYAKVSSAWNYSGHTYLLTDSAMNWSDAESYAQSLGGHLVTINDQGEQDWVLSTLSPFGHLWIGMTDAAEEGTWVWSSGEAATYTNWSSGEPNNSDNWYGGTDANHALLPTDGNWTDLRVERTFRGVIELSGAGTGRSGAGRWAQYLLDVDVADLVAPTVTGVSALPVDGGITSSVVDKLTVSLSEDLDPSTVNVNDRMVWSYGGHFYVVTEGLSWTGSEAQADSLGGHLVTIDDQAEQDWVYETFQRFGSVWIGMTDEAEEGTWVWSGGQAVAYTNWASGQPANHAVYDYGYLDNVSGQWYGYGQTGTIHRGVIELAGPDADGDLVPDVLDAYPSDPLNNFDLREAGTDGTFDTPDDAIYRLTLDPAYTTGTSVGLFIQAGPLPSGHYRFTANSSVTDRSGNRLDGDGNGTGGDAYQRTFDVSLLLGVESGNNDTRGTATGLPLVEDPAGSGSFTGRGVGSIQPPSDPDWWSFEALAGDVISVSVDTPAGDLNSHVNLYDAGGGHLVQDWNSGPDYDAFISHYSISSSGTYYARVSGEGGTTGSYELRVDLARGIDLESDGQYANDVIAGADPLTLSRGDPGHLLATVAGTTMSREGANTDEDVFLLGTLSAGNAVELSTRLPSTSSWNGVLTVVDSSGAAIADEDGEVLDGHVLATIPTDGVYYAKVSSAWNYSGHTYLLTDSAMNWSDAESYAQSLGGHLVTINDQGEQDWVLSTLSPFGHLWIGMTDAAEEGTWVWSSGEAATYTNWSSGEPNNSDNWYGGTDANHALLPTDGNWTDLRVERTFRGVIELSGAGTGRSGAGRWAQYLLDVDVADLVAPTVTGVSALPVDGGITSSVVDKLTVSLSEDLDPSTVNVNDRMVWSYGGHFYVITGAMSWTDGKAQAESLGGHLVTIDDQAEQDWVYETFQRFGRVWIGMTDEVEEGTWVWSGGQAAGYTNWASGQPTSHETYDYGYLDTVSGQWHSTYDTLGSTRGVIELDGPDADGDLVPDVLDAYPSDPLNNFDLREAGTDGAFDTPDDAIYRLTLDPAYTTGTSAGLFIQGGPLPSGHYRFTANSSVTDRSGNRLDGDGNGTGGDAYQRTFDVSLLLGVESGNNDTRGTATGLPLVEDPAGSGSFTGRGVGSIQPSSDPDWWSFEALAGDVISVSVDTPAGDLNSHVNLYDAGGGHLVQDWNSGPDYDAFISHYSISSSGTYYARVSGEGGTTGSYELRVDLARGIDLESDGQYANDVIAGADPLTLSRGDPGHLLATVAGTTMSREGANTDEDVFLLGTLSAGNVVELSTRLPSASSWNGVLTVVDSSGAAVADDDGDALDGHVLATIPTDGVYYAKVSSAWNYSGHTYLLTDSAMNWSDAESYAQSLGGHLVTINDQGEQDWVLSTLSPFGHLWIGMTDEAEEGTWVWSSGEAVTYTNWASGQPNNNDNWYGGTDANCGFLPNDGNWTDLRAERLFRGVIELADAGTGESGAGPWAQYLLDVDVADLVAPTVTGISALPADGGTTSSVVDKLTVSLSEDLDPATVNVNNRMVWSYGGHFYVVTGAMSWTGSEAQAESLGGHLVTIDDQAEHDWVYETFQRFGRVWIGMTDEVEEGTWAWSGGQAVGYTNWASGQPYSHETYDYGYLDNVNGQWHATYDTLGSTRGVIELDGPDADGDLVPDVLDAYPSDPLNNFDLREAGTDGTFDTPDDAIYRLTLDPAYTTGTSVGLFIQAGPLPSGHYRFTANSSVTDRSGNRLDGDGNGTGGDAYQRTFDVSLLLGVESGNNDTRGTATGLPLVEDPAGSGSFTGRGVGSIQPSSDPDWWSFEALAGDVISVSVDTPSSDLNPYVNLYDASGGYLVQDQNSGPEYDAFISHYSISSSGTYYALVSGEGGTTGSYELRVDLARDIDLESDANYSNDSVGGANPISLTTAGTDRTGTIAGTVMAPEPGNVDQDYFSLGSVQDGETIFLSLRLPESTALRPVIEIRDAGNGLVGLAANPSDSAALVDIATPGIYYAVVVATTGQGPRGQYLLEAAISPTGDREFADLVPSSVAGPATAASGEIVTFVWEAGNYGTGVSNADSWFDRVVLSSNDRYGDGDDIYLGSVRHDGALAVGDPAYPGQLEVRLPLGISGDYWIFVEADETGAVFEYIFESNNIAVSASRIVVDLTPYGDLAASDVGSPVIGVAGQAYSVNWLVTNLGNGTTGEGTPGDDVAGWTDRIVLSRNMTLGDGDDVFVADVPHTGALAASEGYAGSWAGNLPAGLSGDYYVIVTTDVDDSVYEYDDTHSNTAVSDTTITVAPAAFADLTVKTFAPPAEAGAGSQVQLSWTVENTVNAWAATPVDQWYDSVVLSQDDIYGNGDDRDLGSFVHNGALGIGQTYDGAGTVTIPTGIVGPYHLFLVTDVGNAVYEFTHEGNNASSASDIQVTLPDLTIGAVDRSQLAWTGQALEISGQIAATVKNEGASDAPAPFSVRFFEDRNGNNDYDEGTDVVLGTAEVSQDLPAGGSVVVAADLSGKVLFAWNIVWAQVDSGEAVAELDETNNLAHSGQSCVYAPGIGGFDPVVEWNKATFTDVPAWNQVAMTPVVVDLDLDGIPEVIFTSFGRAENAWSQSVLRAIRGIDGAELWTVDNPAYYMDGLASLAVGDIDGDDLPEIVGIHASEVPIAFEHDGTFKWLGSPIWGGGDNAAPSLADLDGDGTPEIIVGATVLNNDGTIRWEGNAVGGQGRGANESTGRNEALSAVADLDLDGVPEVVAGKSAYRADGALFWNASVPDGLPALGNFDEDPFPEIVLVSGGQIYLLSHEGNVQWGPVAIPGGGAGGPPTVADVDGDGEPEIGVAGATRYVVFETDGTVKWQVPASDQSSSVTGSSVFDFEGDGSAEVIYGDEFYLRVYRGTDGHVLLEVPKGSVTLYEMPVIVDVDSDGSAEIVAAANDLRNGNETGIFVIGDANDTWIGTRQIWNQHTYHITNVNDDGTIPSHEANNWETHNNFRLNAWTSLDPHAAADLTASFARVDQGETDVTYTVRIGNGGAIVAPTETKVAFYNGDPNGGGVLLGTATTTTPLLPGQYEDVQVTVAAVELADLWVRADDDGAGEGQVREGNKLNNLHHPVFTTPVVAAQLANDAGSDTGDGLTHDPRIAGAVTENNAAVVLTAWLDGGDPIDVSHALRVDGTFELTEADLAGPAGGPLDQGPHFLDLQAEDEYGVRSAVVRLSFDLDTVIPAQLSAVTMAEDTGPSADDGLTADTTPTFAWQAAAETDFWKYQYRLDGGQWTDAAGDPAEATITLTPGQGAHTFEARCVDLAGNEGLASEAFDFTVDTSMPPSPASVSVADDTGVSASDRITADNTLTVSWPAVTDLTGVAYYQYQIDGAGWVDQTGTSVDLGLSDGPHNFDVRAVDGAGNTGMARTAAIVVDRQSPGVVSHEPTGTSAEPVDHVDVTFDEVIDVATLGGALTLYHEAAPVPDPGFVVSGPVGRTYRVAFTPQMQNGSFRLEVAASVADLAGNLMPAAYDAAFAQALPDLVAVSIAIVPPATDLQFGQTVAVSLTVESDPAGGQVSGIWNDAVYLSHGNDVLDAGDQLLDLRPGPGSLPPGDNYTTDIEVTLPLSTDLAEGNYYLILKTDSDEALAELDEPNNIVASAELNITLPPTADLTVADVATLGPLTAGREATFTWTIHNIGGVDATGPWIEEVLVSADGAVGGDVSLGTVTFNGTVAAGGSEARAATLTIPQTFPRTGAVYFVVATDTADSVFESDDDNNASVSIAGATIADSLSIAASQTSVAETAGPNALRFIVTRSGSVVGGLTVNLVSSDTTEIVVPATVTVPPGQHSTAVFAEVLDDTIVDPSQVVTVTAAAAGYVGDAVDIGVLDDDTPSLRIELDVESMIEGETAGGTVYRSYGMDADPTYMTGEPLTVSLAEVSCEQFTLPATVEIPAGSLEASFDVTATDDEIPELDADFTIEAAAAGYTSGTAAVTVVDNDLPTLTIIPAWAEVSEGAGATALTAVVQRAEATGSDLRVRLASSDTTAAVVPPEVLIPANETGVSFIIGAVDDTVVDGTQLAVISAVGVIPSCQCCAPNPTGTATANIEVLDDDGATLTVAFDRDLVNEGIIAAAVLTVSRNTAPVGDLEVTLTASDTAELHVPATVTIPDGRTSVTVAADSLDDGVTDGNKTVNLTASASGFVQGVDSIIVTDVDLPDLVIVQVNGPAEVATEELFNITYRMENRGLAEAVASNADLGNDFDGSWTQRVYLSSDAYIGGDLLVGQYVFTGTMPVGSEWGLERTIPTWAPMTAGDYYLVVETDVYNTVAEGVESNNTTISDQAVTVQPAYTAHVQTPLEIGAVGLNLAEITPVVMSGSATNTGGAPAQYVPVSIHIKVRNTERVIAAITDEFGQFSTTWTPLPGEGGRYTIGAAHPGMDEAPVQDEFVLMGMKVVPTSSSVYVIEGDTRSTAFTLHNLADLPLTGLSVTLADVPSSLDVTTTPLAGQTIAALGSVTLEVSVHAINATYTSGTFTLRVDSAEGASVMMPVSVRVEPLVARLSADPGQLTGGMLRGSDRVVEFEITNTGGLATGPIEVLLPPNERWLHLATAQEMASIDPGQSAMVSLLLMPPADMSLGNYSGHMTLNFTSGHVNVPFTFRALSDATGDLVIKAVDEYYFYTAEAPALAGARVRVLDALSGVQIFSDTTDANGEVGLVDLAEGYYKVEVRADKHNTYSKTLLVEAGKTNNVRAFLSLQTVQATWTVVETQVEDHYEIVIETVFETNVPAPVVTVTPAYIDLSPLTAPGQKMQINMTIENHGLIQAEEMGLYFGEHPMYEFAPLIEDIGILPAMSSLTVPVIIERLAYDEETSDATAPEASPGQNMCHIPAQVYWVVWCAGTPDERKLFPITIGGIDYNCGGGGGGSGGGGGGGWGGGGLGGGGGPGSARTYTPTTGGSTCDPCLNELLGALLCAVPGGCLVGGAIGGALGEGEDFVTGRNGNTWQDGIKGGAVGCAISGLAKLTGVGALFSCIYAGGQALGCLLGNISIVPGAPLPTTDLATATAEHGDVTDFRWGGESLLPTDYPYFDFDLLDLPWAGDVEQPATMWLTSIGWEMTVLEPMAYIFGNTWWMRDFEYDDLVTTIGQFLDATYTTTDEGYYVSETERDAVISTAMGFGMSQEAVAAMIDRWNRTMAYWDNEWFTAQDVPDGMSTDFIEPEKLNDKYTCALQAMTETEEAGFADPAEAAIAMHEILVTAAADISGAGVCAKVKLQIKQEAVITRDAFEATLELDNSTDGALENVEVEVVITDVNDLDTTDLFGIYDPTIQGFVPAGEAWTLSGNATGVANWLIVPTTEAAPEEATVFYVGAILHYTDQGREVSMPLDGVPITVLPQAELDLKYFHQRDVFSDDPWTEPVEPSQPFELAVMIDNYGAGEARNLRITSAQPEIIENEKGLLIDFKIIASQVDGQPMTPSLTTNFGDIGPGEISIGRWWLTSTLQGHFISYDATFQHIDGLGDERLSLIKSVEIYEMIQSVYAGGAFDDALGDFLTNELPDAQDLPDTLHLSDGSVADVALADETLAAVTGTLSPTNFEVTLTAAMGEGWSYLRLTDRDPGNGAYKLVSVVRGDGTVLPVENFWQTDRRFVGMGQRPVLEDSLHLLDYNGTESATYTLTYTSLDRTGPRIEALTGPVQQVSEDDVDEVLVEFSERLKAGSFTAGALALTRDGGANLIDDTVAITATGPNAYRLAGLSSWTSQPGLYRLTVTAAEVEDVFSNPGVGSATTIWSRVTSGPWATGITGAEAHTNTAVSALQIAFSEPVDVETLDLGDVTLRHDGAPVDLSGAFFSEVSPDVFALGGLSGVTADQGAYVFMVDTAALADLEGDLGFGTMTLGWTMDTTPPTVQQVDLGVNSPTPSPVDTVTVLFDEPVVAGPATPVTLTLDGAPVAGGAIVDVDPANNRRVRIRGLSSLQGADGEYRLTLDLSGVTDRAGNTAVGSAEAVWTLDTMAPTPPADLAISPDNGQSNTDGVTDTGELTLTGTLGQTGLSVSVYNLTLDVSLGSAVVNGTSFSKELSLAAGGTYELRVTAADEAGNTSSSFLHVLFDAIDLAITAVTGVPAGYNTEPVTEIGITFSAPIDPATLTPDVMSMIGAGLDLSLAAMTIDPVAGTTATYRLGNLPAAVGVYGAYKLEIDLTQVRKYGSGRNGAAKRILGWSVVPADTTAPTVTSVVVQNGLAAPESVERIDVTFSEKMQLAGMVGDGSVAAAVALARVDAAGQVVEHVMLKPHEFTTDVSSTVLTWQASGGPLPGGRYVLQLRAGSFLDQADNALDGQASQTFDIGMVQFAAESLVQADGAPIAMNAYSTPALAEMTGDDLPDLLVGEKTAASLGRVAIYRNTGSGLAFDSYALDIAGNVLNLPATGCLGVSVRSVDWNDDGLGDLLFGQADGAVKIALNAGDPSGVRFTAPLTVYAGVHPVDVGTRATVEVADLTGDGLFDLVVGAYDARLRMYENTGTVGSPDFAAATLLTLRSGAEIVIPTGRSAPTIADVTGDGRPDLVCGNTAGEMWLYANVGDATPVYLDAVPVQAAGVNIDLPGDVRSRPFAGDATGDGRLDLLVGSQDVMVRLYEGLATTDAAESTFLVASIDGPAALDEGDARDFTVAPFGAGATCEWALGDGATATDVETVAHAYDDEGVYHIVVTVEAYNMTAATTKTVTVANVNPVITDLGGDDAVYVGDTAEFTATATDAGTDELTYEWDFGDGSDLVVGVDRTAVTHTYSQAGAYTVTLTVTDGDGGGDQATWDVTVTTIIPAAVDLLPVSDTGMSGTDDITMLDNSEAAKALQFEVTGTIDGSVVTVYADGVAIGSAAGAEATTTVTTEGTRDLVNGMHSITARQARPGGPESADSPELAITIDTIAPDSAVALGEMTQSAEFLVTWTGQDGPGGSGVASYDVHVATDGGDYVLWQEGTTEAQSLFIGETGHLYAFYSQARDTGGNVEDVPALADAARCVFNVTEAGVDTLITNRAVTLGADASLDIAIAGGGNEFQAGVYTLIEATGGLTGTFADVTDLGAYVSVNGSGLAYDGAAGTATLTLDKSLNPGDANLDGQTDVSDRIIWNAHNFTFDTTFRTGDFNGDGATDVSDRIIWNTRNFTFASAPQAAPAAATRKVGGPAPTADPYDAPAPVPSAWTVADDLAAATSIQADSENLFALAAFSGAPAAEATPAVEAGPTDGELAADPLVSMQTPSIKVEIAATSLSSQVQSPGTARPVDDDGPAAAQLEVDIDTDLADLLGAEDECHEALAGD